MSDVELSKAVQIIIRHGDMGIRSLATALRDYYTDVTEEYVTDFKLHDKYLGRAYTFTIQDHQLRANNSVVLCLHNPDHILNDTSYSTRRCGDCGKDIY